MTNPKEDLLLICPRCATTRTGEILGATVNYAGEYNGPLTLMICHSCKLVFCIAKACEREKPPEEN